MSFYELQLAVLLDPKVFCMFFIILIKRFIVYSFNRQPLHVKIKNGLFFANKRWIAKFDPKEKKRKEEIYARQVEQAKRNYKRALLENFTLVVVAGVVCLAIFLAPGSYESY